MAWGMLDDKFHRNPKVRALRKSGAKGREALGVWLYWWSWCLDDPAHNGIVPRDEMPAGDIKAAALLEMSGLWDPLPDGWHVHDFEDYLPGGRAVRDEKREAKRTADRVRVASIRATSRESVAEVARDISDTDATSVANVAATSRESVAKMSHSPPACTRDRAPACTGIPSPPIPSHPNQYTPEPDPETSVCEDGKPWDIRSLTRVISQRRAIAGGGPYNNEKSDYQLLIDAVELFRKADPGAPDKAAAYAFDAWAATEWARHVKLSVKAWLKDPGQLLIFAKAP